jgi:hypothetical protein
MKTPSGSSQGKTAEKGKCPLRVIVTLYPFEKGSVVSFL